MMHTLHECTLHLLPARVAVVGGEVLAGGTLPGGLQGGGQPERYDDACVIGHPERRLAAGLEPRIALQHVLQRHAVGQHLLRACTAPSCSADHR